MPQHLRQNEDRLRPPEIVQFCKPYWNDSLLKLQKGPDMHKRFPCGGIHRRQFFQTVGIGAVAAPLLPLTAAPVSASSSTDEQKVLGIPGPYAGRVVEVTHPGIIASGQINRQVVRSSMERGMRELTGADDWSSAWRRFFQPGDVVGVKVNPVGNPLANTTTEVLLETIAGLRAAGVRAKDIVVFDRYKDMFIEAGFHKSVPDGVRWDGLTPEPDSTQLKIAGYDPDEYVTMELVHPSHEPKDDRTRRSHLGLVLTKQVGKIVNLAVLKDHGSAGVTLALKNMSHGFVNNVARSHGGPQYNVCNQFIPQVVNHPIIRQKVVLHILDGIKGVFQGGPFGREPNWVWEHKSLFFATDPVAMDHIGWEIIDQRRKSAGLAPVAAVGKMGLDAEREGFDMRQPQHIPLAGALGLGVFDTEKIEHRSIALV